jgi:hypothetical protein
MLQKLLNKAPLMAGMDEVELWQPRHWPYLLPHFVVGIVTAMIVWKMIGLLAS